MFYTYIITDEVIYVNLPGIFKNQVGENVKNSQEIFYSIKKAESTFEDFPFDALIQTNCKAFKAKVIGKTTNYLVTANGHILNFKDIISVKKMSK